MQNFIETLASDKSVNLLRSWTFGTACPSDAERMADGSASRFTALAPATLLDRFALRYTTFDDRSPSALSIEHHLRRIIGLDLIDEAEAVADGDQNGWSAAARAANTVAAAESVLGFRLRELAQELHGMFVADEADGQRPIAVALLERRFDDAERQIRDHAGENAPAWALLRVRCMHLAGIIHIQRAAAFVVAYERVLARADRRKQAPKVARLWGAVKNRVALLTSVSRRIEAGGALLSRGRPLQILARARRTAEDELRKDHERLSAVGSATDIPLVANVAMQFMDWIGRVRRMRAGWVQTLRAAAGLPEVGDIGRCHPFTLWSGGLTPRSFVLATSMSWVGYVWLMHEGLKGQGSKRSGNAAFDQGLDASTHAAERLASAMIRFMTGTAEDEDPSQSATEARQLARAFKREVQRLRDDGFQAGDPETCLKSRWLALFDAFDPFPDFKS